MNSETLRLDGLNPHHDRRCLFVWMCLLSYVESSNCVTILSNSTTIAGLSLRGAIPRRSSSPRGEAVILIARAPGRRRSVRRAAAGRARAAARRAAPGTTRSRTNRDAFGNRSPNSAAQCADVETRTKVQSCVT